MKCKTALMSISLMMGLVFVFALLALKLKYTDLNDNNEPTCEAYSKMRTGKHGEKYEIFTLTSQVRLDPIHGVDRKMDDGKIGVWVCKSE